MYIYYFNTKKGSKEILISKGSIFRTHGDNLYQVLLEDGNIINKRFIKVQKEPGKIYRRCFWLESDDKDLANSIIENYEKEKYLEFSKLKGKFEPT